jgi:acyl-CoA synthetase (AMP-forming)/AMP-acid ligase II
MSAPTKAYRRLPAMSAEEAGGVVCRAVAHRRRTLQPWWSRPAELVATAAKGPVERALAASLRLAGAVEPLRALAGVGLLRPGRLLRLAAASRRHGATLAAALAAGPRDGVAVVDGAGAMTRAELTSAARALAAGVTTTLGVPAPARVGVACGAHRGFAVTVAGLGLLGLDAVLLPPDLPARPLAEVVARERVTAIIHDGQITDAALPAATWTDLGRAGGAAPAPRVRRGGKPRGRQRGTALARLRGRVRGRPAGNLGGRGGGRLVVLTSGTTGLPRGVVRRLPLRTLVGPVTTHLRHVALRPGVPIVVAAPPHHGYGLSYLAAGLTLGAPVVLAADLDAGQLWEALRTHRAGLLVALPVQLSRLCDVDGPVAPESLRAVVTGAAPLSPELTGRLLDRFGDRVFNLYGSTEAGWAAIATPADLRAVPGTVGRAPRGVALTVRGPDGVALPPGQLGEVHVAGWSCTPHATGDLGRLDRVGRLTLAGRMDDMIVSGGENVYPGPVRAALAAHPLVRDAVVEAVPDAEFGQRLRARVRLRDGAGVTGAELRGWLRERLAPAQVPRDIVVSDEAPT